MSKALWLGSSVNELSMAKERYCKQKEPRDVLHLKVGRVCAEIPGVRSDVSVRVETVKQGQVSQPEPWRTR